MEILLTEDDKILANGLTAQLRGAGCRVTHAPNGPVAEYLLSEQSFDIVILDLGLPLMDGFTVLKRIRTMHPTLPVVVLTALDKLDSRVESLNAGADDYVTKPFDFPELQARLNAVLRRSRQSPHSDLAAAGLRFDRQTRRTFIGSESVDLSPRETILLDLLLINMDKVVTKEQILQAWTDEGNEVGIGNSAEVHIHRLRKKLERSGVAIRTVRGLGYLLEAQPVAEPSA
ncbi:response regulator transcription factor [Roseateles sp. P5_E11]